MVCIKIRLFGGELIAACTSKNFEENRPPIESHAIQPRTSKIGISRSKGLILGLIIDC